MVPDERDHTNCANTWFQLFLQNTPAPTHLCLVETVELGQGWDELPPGTIKSRRGLIFSLSLSKGLIFFFVYIFCFNLVIILCWRRNTIQSREKRTGHSKTGYFHCNNYAKKQHYIHWEIERSLVTILLFSLLVKSSCWWCPYLCRSWTMNLQSQKHCPASSSALSLCTTWCHFQSLTTEGQFT